MERGLERVTNANSVCRNAHTQTHEQRMSEHNMNVIWCFVSRFIEKKKNRRRLFFFSATMQFQHQTLRSRPNTTHNIRKISILNTNRLFVFCIRSNTFVTFNLLLVAYINYKLPLKKYAQSYYWHASYSLMLIIRYPIMLANSV